MADLPRAAGTSRPAVRHVGAVRREHAGVDNDRPSAARLGVAHSAAMASMNCASSSSVRPSITMSSLGREQPRGCEHALAAILEGLAVEDGAMFLVHRHGEDTVLG